MKLFNSRYVCSGKFGLVLCLQLSLAGTVVAKQSDQLGDESYTLLRLHAPVQNSEPVPEIDWQAIRSFDERNGLSLVDQIDFKNGSDSPLSIEGGQLENGQTLARGELVLNPVPGMQSLFGGEFIYSDLSPEQSYEQQWTGWVNTESVSELRAETFLFSSWKPLADSNFDLHGGAAIEYLEIERNGESRLSRIYTYLKPRLALSYQQSDDQQWLLGVQRTVGETGQALVTNASVNDIWRANPDIEPQTAWEFIAEYEKGFMDALGELKLKAFYNQLENVIDEVAVNETDSAPGNIGSGYLRGLRLDTGVDLWGGIRGSAAMLYQQSQVTDPFINEKRSLSNVSDKQISLGLHKAFETLPLSTGINYLHQSNYENQRVNEISEISHSQGYLDTYLEWQLPGDFSMRFDIKNLLDNTVITRRTRYQLSNSQRLMDSMELETNQSGRFWGLSMSGKI